MNNEHANLILKFLLGHFILFVHLFENLIEVV